MSLNRRMNLTFVFRPSGEPPSAGKEKEPEEATPKTIDLAGVYRVEGTNPNGSKYRGMVALAQDNDQFNFTWWIGKDVFRGSGHFAGKMLMVNWGDKTPVIYTFGDEGALDGEWADGSATETLELVANAAPGDIGLSEGSYRVDGKNAAGHLFFRADDGAHGFELWHSDGTLAGNLLTVDWGASTPVVYALKSDGSLTGLWDAGKGEETLTPEE